ncbi:MAG: TonB-dependent receptor [Crocinitomicaceae bacterium]|nr:TonB-dependent receptor [Crocinitomicaceae bacterium]
MTRIILVIVLLVVSSNIWSQNIVIVEDETGDPVAQAKVSVISYIDSTQVENTISDWNGKSRFYSKFEEKVYVKIYALGYYPFTDTLWLQSTNKFSLIKLQQIEEMVVTAQLKATSLEKAVQKIDVITAEQIQKSGAVNLSEILVYKTNIRISQDNILGSSMEIGGATGQNIKILIDGVPVIGRQNGNIDLSQVNLNNVERIEIIEGPLSVNYGTNALAGTINIITKKKTSQGVEIILAPFYESSGVYNLNGTVSFSKGKNSLSINGGRNYFDGWSANDPFIEFPKERLADSNRVKTWKPKEQYFGNVRYDFRMKNWQSSISGSYFHEEIMNRGMPKAPYYETAFDDYYNTQRLDVSFVNDFTIRKSKLKLLLAHNFFKRKKNTYIIDLTSLDQLLSESNGSQDTSRFDNTMARMEFISRLHKKLDYQIGVDLYNYTGWGRRIESGEQDMGDYAGFITLDWKITDSLIVKPGLRYAYNTNFESPLIPSLNLLYRVKRISVRGSVARGFRAPSMKEMYLDFVDVNHDITGNPNLKPESSWNYSLNLNWIKSMKSNGMYKMEWNGSYNEIENLISLAVKEDGSYSYVNIGEFSSISNRLKFVFRQQRLRLTLDLAYIGRFNYLSNSTSTSNYLFSPEIGVNSEFDIIKKRLSFNTFYKFNGRLQTYSLNSNDEVVESRQDGFNILDVSFSSQLLKDRNLVLTIGAKNVLNVQTVNVTGQVQAIHSSAGNFNVGKGTSIFFSMIYKLKLKKN